VLPFAEKTELDIEKLEREKMFITDFHRITLNLKTEVVTTDEHGSSQKTRPHMKKYRHQIGDYRI
jgi:hypothetical protein